MAQDLSCLTDSELVSSLKALVRHERGQLVSVLRHLAELDLRRLAVKKGFPSLFDYCVRELRYAEGEAARRIHAARAAAKYPLIYRAIDRGLLSLTAVSLLAPHLNRDNQRRLIRSALGRNKRDVEALIAALGPAGRPVERIRFLGIPPAAPTAARSEQAMDSGVDEMLVPAPDLEMTASPRKNENAGPGPERRRVQFTFSADERLLGEIDRAKGLLRGKYPRPGLEEVLSEGVKALLDRIDPARRQVKTPRRSPDEVEVSGPEPGKDEKRRTRHGRTVPGWVKEEVWWRDGGRCVFVSPEGRECGSGEGLQFDHIRPWAAGGRSDDPWNIRLLCRAHNGLEARRVFGDGVVDTAIARGPLPSRLASFNEDISANGT